MMTKDHFVNLSAILPLRPGEIDRLDLRPQVDLSKRGSSRIKSNATVTRRAHAVARQPVLRVVSR